MGDRPGTICIQRSLTFTSASSQMTFIRRKAMFWNTTGSNLALHLLPSEFILLLHTGCFAWWIKLRLEVEAKLFCEQLIPDNHWWKNYSTSQLVNKLSCQNKKKTMQTFSPDFNAFLRTRRRISGCLFSHFPPGLHSADFILHFTPSLRSPV